MSAVDTPFYLFFLIMGLVAGGLVVWLLMAEGSFEIGEVRGGPVDEVEAPLLVRTLAEYGVTVDEATVAQVLTLHAAYFDGRIYDSLAAAERARIAAERARIAAERVVQAAGPVAPTEAGAAATEGTAAPARRRRAKPPQEG
jgi:hypothetical protein